MLTPVTQSCVEARREAADECSPDQSIRVGPPEGACDNPPKPLYKLLTGVLQKATIQSAAGNDIPQAIQSPAYDMLRLFQLTEAQLGEIFQLWHARSSAENESPRDAVCQWAVDNLDFLYSAVPASYPRTSKVQEEMTTFSITALALGGFTTFLVLLTSIKVLWDRNHVSIRLAQVEFLWLLLCGALMIAVGAILISVPTTTATCKASIYLINVGYTLELVPLIVKVAAVNRVIRAASRMRRVTLNRTHLFRTVALISVLCIGYLSLWTWFDPPHKKADYTLTGSTVQTERGTETVVEVNFFCGAGESNVWQYVAVGWNALLLFTATVLAFQMRNIHESFNESKTLAFMIYSHLVFVILRICTFLLTDLLQGTTLDSIMSVLYSVDTILTLFIYIGPKFVKERGGSTYSTRPEGSHLGSVHVSGLNTTPRASHASLGSLGIRSEHSVTMRPFKNEEVSLDLGSDPETAAKDDECPTTDEDQGSSASSTIRQNDRIIREGSFFRVLKRALSEKELDAKDGLNREEAE